jgi:hypothetical protein
VIVRRPSHLGSSAGSADPLASVSGVVGDDRGSAAVEAVLVIPVLMLLLVVVIQCALWAHAGQVVGLAASEGDRTARSVGGGPGVGIAEARSILRSSGRDLASSDVVGEIVSGDLVRITVTGRAVSIIPGLSLPVSSVAVGPLQEFRGSE